MIENEELKKDITQAKSVVKIQVKEKLGYLLVFITSLVVAIVMPFVTNSQNPLGIVEYEPTLKWWLGYLVPKFVIAVTGCLIYFMFCEQGRINIRNDKRYLDACSQLFVKEDNNEPLSPKQYHSKSNTKKILITFTLSIIFALLVPEDLENFDKIKFLIQMLNIVISLVPAICSGYMSMIDEENYWTIEFPRYINNLKQKENNTNEC